MAEVAPAAGGGANRRFLFIVGGLAGLLVLGLLALAAVFVLPGLTGGNRGPAAALTLTPTRVAVVSTSAGGTVVPTATLVVGAFAVTGTPRATTGTPGAGGSALSSGSAADATSTAAAAATQTTITRNTTVVFITATPPGGSGTGTGTGTGGTGTGQGNPTPSAGGTSKGGLTGNTPAPGQTPDKGGVVNATPTPASNGELPSSGLGENLLLLAGGLILVIVLFAARRARTSA